jgi:hypothetical protein
LMQPCKKKNGPVAGPLKGNSIKNRDLSWCQ